MLIGRTDFAVRSINQVLAVERNADVPDSRPLEHILRDLQGSGRRDRISVGDIVDSFQHRPLGLLLAVFGVIASLPVIGAIPGISILTASLVLIVVGQSLLGGGSLWLPPLVRRQEVDRRKLDRAVEKARTRWRRYFPE